MKKLLYTIMAEILAFIGAGFFWIADILDFGFKILRNIAIAIAVIFVGFLAGVVIIGILQGLTWLFGGLIFCIGWLLIATGAFIMAHLIAGGIIIVLTIVVLRLLLVTTRHGVPDAC